ncbi:hypothetical protein [uncultured Corynebacterium sp.]|nr:hypothetical protein [uncultured Corynebacterium sp.]
MPEVSGSDVTAPSTQSIFPHTLQTALHLIPTLKRLSKILGIARR